MNRITYPYLNEIEKLVSEKLVGKQKHPDYPIWVYNYSPKAQFMPVAEWTPVLADCRGLILNEHGEIVARPFSKFWNFSQMLHLVPAAERFTVWEKLDGSLLNVANYAGARIVATRGSFLSDQAVWSKHWFDRKHSNFLPEDLTYCFETIFPENRIVVDYKGRAECVLLAIRDDNGLDLWDAFDRETRFVKARKFDGITDFSVVDTDPQFQGEEGFVVQWESGLRGKIKAEEYKRLHRLITQVSTRSIWELLRSGSGIAELVDRVPAEFAAWVNETASTLTSKHAEIVETAWMNFHEAPRNCDRKTYAEYAKKAAFPQLLFSMLDGREIGDAVWKIVEPAWSTPFKGEIE